MRSVAYYRVSSTGQAQDDRGGIPRQRELVGEYAKANDFTIVQEFSETYTGTKLADREALAQMIAYLENHSDVGMVLVENMDRLARDTLVGLLLIDDLKKCGVEVHGVDGRNAADDDPTSKLVTTILMAIAAYQRDMLVLRMSLGRMRKRAAGYRVEGRLPYGSKPHEAQILKIATELREKEGLTLREIGERLNEAGHRNAWGNLWSVQALSRVLRAHRRSIRPVPAE